jgi:hypothetical protein
MSTGIGGCHSFYFAKYIVTLTDHESLAIDTEPQHKQFFAQPSARPPKLHGTAA